jgi:hypothetical protein
MSINFTLSMDDLIAFNRYHLCHSPMVRRTYWKGLLLPPLVWTVLCLLLSRLAVSAQGTWLESIRDLLPLFLGAPVYLVIFPLVRKRCISRQIGALLREGDNTSVLGAHRVEATPEGFCQTNNSGLTQCKWNAIKKVAISDDHIFLYLSAVSAFIIPKKGFTDEIQLTAFLGELDRYRQATRESGSG